MKISVIVPVYNVEPFIRECFTSIANQTYQGQMECIFVDDCGQDRSVEILEKLINDYQDPIAFSIIHHEHNKGLSEARNTGIRHATGDYLYFLDSDDFILPDCIEKLVALVEKYREVDVVQGNTQWKGKGLRLGEVDIPEYSANYKWIKKAFLRLFPVAIEAWNKLLNRKFIIDNNLFFAPGIVHEDVPWHLLLSKHTRRIAFCKSATYVYRDNSTGITKSIADERKVLSEVVRVACGYVGGNYAVDELFFIISILKMNGVYDETFLTDLLYHLGYPVCLLRLLLTLQQSLLHTHKFTMKGLAVRVAYYSLVRIINLTFKGK